MEGKVIETEETLIIETPERVPLEFALASIGNRFLAVAIDHFIQFFSIFAVAWLLMTIAEGSSSRIWRESSFESLPRWTVALAILGAFLIFALYFIVFEWLWNGQTPGKRLMKLRVIRDDGRPITPWEAIARNLLRIADAAPGFVIPVYSVGLLAIFLSGRDQRFGDMFAGTVVIRERQNEAPSYQETFSAQVRDPATIRVQKAVAFTADLSSLKDDEVEIVETFLRRRWDLSERQRIWMAWRIALPLMFRLRPRYEMADFSYEGFLEELMHRYHARSRYLN